jgi:hypothetical protein
MTIEYLGYSLHRMRSVILVTDGHDVWPFNSWTAAVEWIEGRGQGNRPLAQVR